LNTPTRARARPAGAHYPAGPDRHVSGKTLQPTINVRHRRAFLSKSIRLFHYAFALMRALCGRLPLAYRAQY
jgi:hypothetical protein